nr:PREDICTED: immunoglobulin superfamily member 10 [Lepisosteus oculatus]XP_015216100.1 PREDICTED: immunoglobulin superfamily member 10 [Lepisosteus oculatus]XP_015216101.1 PREDICTED: immunoglobulin superfamily member 10 [Lepisosteus oculatus]
MKVFSQGTVYLRWRLLAFLCFWARMIPRSTGCPRSCACYVPTEVHCTFRYLTAIPGEIQPAVERINFGYNSLTGLKERDFSGLGRLELLMLHSNAIQTIEDKAFSDLLSLQVLKMSYNKVQEINKGTFHGLRSLVRLHMDHNKIEFIHPEAFYGLSSLKLVHLEGNSLQQLHPDTFVTMRFSQIFRISSVKNIYLSDNSLRSLPPEIFSYAPELESVFLHGNPWSCDCRTAWLPQWMEQNPGVLKCKRDRKYARGQQCPTCETPAASKGKDIAELPSAALSCSKPWIHSDLKQRNISIDEGDFTPVSSRDFIAPIGSMVLNMTDQSQNEASVVCTVQRPASMRGVSVEEKEDLTALSATLATFLICNIDYDHIQQLWRILATYSDSPLKLERGLLLTKTPSMIYKYHQKTADEEDDISTDIEAEIKADPPWLMQGEVTLQLDRATTTFTTLHIKYSSEVQMLVESKAPKPHKYSWAMIRRDNATKTEHTVLTGGTAELDCKTLGEPKPSIEWILPDGSKVRAPYNSEDGRIRISESGKLTLGAADSSDAGLYRCIATNYLDADVLAFRITVLTADVEETDVNGAQITRSLGESLFLHCGSEGNPEASINWILPDHTVLDKSFGNKEVYPNGTLGIQGLTERDRGFYRCLAANFWGADILSSSILFSDVKRNEVPSKVVKKVLSDGEGSGNELDSHLEETDYEELSARASHRTRQESRTLTSSRMYPKRKTTQGRNKSDLTQRRNGVSSTRRVWGNRRTFNTTSRKADPQRWVEIMQKAQKNKTNENQKTTERIPSQHIAGLSGDGEEASGETLTEDELLAIVTDTPNPGLTTHKVTTSVHLETGVFPIVTPAAPVTTMSHSDEDTALISTRPTPFQTTLHHTVSPKGIHTTTPHQNSEQTFTKPITSKQKVTEPSKNDMQLMYSGEPTEVVGSAVPLLMTGFPNTTSLIEKPGPLLEPVVHSSTDPDRQSPFTAVTATEGQRDEITFHTTQKISSPRLPSGSTIISHNRIQIITGGTSSLEGNKPRTSKRRKLPGRRRIIRPNRITDIHAYLNRLSKSSKKTSTDDEDESTDPISIEQTTKCECQITDTPSDTRTVKPVATEDTATDANRATKDRIDKLPTKPHMGSTPQMKTSQSVTTTLDTLLATTASSMFTKTITLQTKVSRGIITTPVTQPLATSRPTTEAPKSVLTSAYTLPERTHAPTTLVKSTGKAESYYTTTTKATTTSSKVIYGKVPWHKFFGNRYSQKELLNRLRRPKKPVLATKSAPVKTTTTTAPAEVTTALLPTLESLVTPMTTMTTLINKDTVIQSSGPLSGYSSGSSSTSSEAAKVTISPITASSQIEDIKSLSSSASFDMMFSTTTIALPLTTTKDISDPSTVVEQSASSGFASGSPSAEDPTTVKIVPALTPARTTSRTSTAAGTGPPASRSNTKSRTRGSRKHMGTPRRKGIRRRRPGKKLSPTSRTTTTQLKKADTPVTSKTTTAAAKGGLSVSTHTFSKAQRPFSFTDADSKETESTPQADSVSTTKPTTATVRTVSKIETSITSARKITATPLPPSAGFTRTAKPKTTTETAATTSKPAPTVKPTTTTGAKCTAKSTTAAAASTAKPRPRAPSVKSSRFTTQSPLFKKVRPTTFSTTRKHSKPGSGGGSYFVKPEAQIPTISTSGTRSKSTESPGRGSRMREKPNSESREKGKAVIFDTLAILRAEQGYTDSPQAFGREEDNTIAARLDRGAGFDTSTANAIAMEPLPKDQPSKPKIVGGNAASFTVLSNLDAFLPCEAVGYPAPSIRWTKLSSGATLTMKTKRGNKFEVFENGTLSIQNASIQDRGQYLCLAENQHGSDKLLVTLSIVTYPSRILEPKVREMQSLSGNTVEIQCKAEGRPPPFISWILANKTLVRGYGAENGRVSVSSGGTLIIKEVSVYDRGHYKCVASNPAGADTATVKLQVVAAPPSIVEEKRLHMKEEIGRHLKLPCTAQGTPQPTVHWVLLDGTVAKPLHYVNPRVFVFSNGTLYIKSLAAADSGKYECIATSSTGSERRVVTLTVEQAETAPRIVTASGRKTDLSYGDRLLLNCSAVAEPKPRVLWRLPSKAIVDQWHRMGNRIHVLLNGSLIIDSVSEKDAGDYLCIARNRIGDDLLLMKVGVSMKPAKIEYKPFIKKHVPYGNDLRVDCKASGAPEPEISWGLPDGTLVNSALQADDNGGRRRRYVLFENGTLYFNRVSLSEEGDYTCYAENTVGKDEMKVHVTVVTAAPRVKSPAAIYARARSGDMVRFDCEATGEPKPKIMWLLPSHDMITASSDRHLVHVNGSLAVRDLTLTDSGEYVCVARNAAGDDSKVFKLEVDANPPTINGLYRNKTVVKETAVKYTRKLIDCKAEGSPTPQVMWIMPDNIFITAPYYGSRIVVHKNGTLEIRNVRPTDTAEFVCVARSGGGETVMVVQLEVTSMLRRPMFKNPFNEKVVASTGKTTILNCSADGHPPPEIIWLLPNGTRFTNSHRVSRYQLGSDGNLIIYNPSKDDAGKYRCAARNKVGYIEKLIVLEVGQKPYILTRPRGIIQSVSGEPLFLHCLSDGSPRPKILWSIPGGHVLSRPQINGRYVLLENGTLVIRETALHDRGNYVCTARNDAGEASVTVPVIVVGYAPRITNGPPQSARTQAGAAVQLHCAAIGIPKPEITWELPDRSIISTAGKGRPMGSELLHPQGTLVIQKPTRSDSGTYKCLARNHLGTDSRITYVQVI